MQPFLLSHLDLETPAPSPSTRLLELSPLALDIRLLVLVGPHTEMLDRLSCVLWSSEQNNVGTGWVLHRQLVDRHAAATGLLDPSTSGSGEAQRGDVQFWDGEEAVVVCDGADDADRLVGVGFLSGFAGDL
jgi:hypothetical protein